MNKLNENILIIPEDSGIFVYHNNDKVGEVLVDHGGFLLTVELPDTDCAFQIPLVKEMGQAVTQIKSFFTTFE